MTLDHDPLATAIVHALGIDTDVHNVLSVTLRCEQECRPTIEVEFVLPDDGLTEGEHVIFTAPGVGRTIQSFVLNPQRAIPFDPGPGWQRVTEGVDVPRHAVVLRGDGVVVTTDNEYPGTGFYDYDHWWKMPGPIGEVLEVTP